MILAALESKRGGQPLTEQQIHQVVQGVVDGSVTRAQAAAFLSFVFLQGMNPAETTALTKAMTDSGERLSWPRLKGPFVDKHSTGGVGDKVSLVLAPLWAELGVQVPMISGRGLGHTGGTLDKLEAIPGFRVDFEADELHRILGDVGCFINGQTATLAPADRILYALRNETATVPSVPLITASILSKKLAEGLDSLVLDVKVGEGAFMPTLEQARGLADSLMRVGTAAGLEMRLVLSDMNQPLGRAVGNALEVQEAVACLKGEGPQDLEFLTCALVGHPKAAEVLASGAAYERWCRMVRCQGGDPDAPLLGTGCQEQVVTAEKTGWVSQCGAMAIGRAAMALGAGRSRADAQVDPGVGVVVEAKVGDQVERGAPLARVVHRGRGLEEACVLIKSGIAISDAPVAAPPLIHGAVSP